MKRSRSAITGRWVPKWFARANPDTTVEETCCPLTSVIGGTTI